MVGFNEEEQSANAEVNTKNSKTNNSFVYLNCFASATLAINKLKGHVLDSSTAMDLLIKSAKQVKNNDIGEIEDMLITQAKTLDVVFYDALSKLSDLNMIDHIEVFTNIAFKAQSQSRKALTALAELKHPRRTTFIKQQNNAINQQVNNGVKSNSEKSEKFANELIGRSDNETTKMDIGTTIKPVKENISA